MNRYRCRAAASLSRSRMPAITLRSFRRRARGSGVAGCYGSFDPSRDVRRPDDVCADRHHEGFEPSGALAGPTLAGLWRFRRCAQVSSGPQYLLLIGLPILRKQFHLSLDQVLIFPEYFGGRVGIANMLGRFMRHLHALMTPGKPT